MNETFENPAFSNETIGFVKGLKETLNGMLSFIDDQDEQFDIIRSELHELNKPKMRFNQELVYLTAAFKADILNEISKCDIYLDNNINDEERLNALFSLFENRENINNSYKRFLSVSLTTVFGLMQDHPEVGRSLEEMFKRDPERFDHIKELIDTLNEE